MVPAPALPASLRLWNISASGWGRIANQRELWNDDAQGSNYALQLRPTARFSRPQANHRYSGHSGPKVAPQNRAAGSGDRQWRAATLRRSRGYSTAEPRGIAADSPGRR
uniref:(northern house mosquito) hypothetical protein n=2 Tax=Culex pipiens TaxID=7175 RepID=A0A8D8MXT2_CULPI